MCYLLAYHVQIQVQEYDRVWVNESSHIAPVNQNLMQSALPLLLSLSSDFTYNPHIMNSTDTITKSKSRRDHCLPRSGHLSCAENMHFIFAHAHITDLWSECRNCNNRLIPSKTNYHRYALPFAHNKWCCVTSTNSSPQNIYICFRWWLSLFYSLYIRPVYMGARCAFFVWVVHMGDWYALPVHTAHIYSPYVQVVHIGF